MDTLKKIQAANPLDGISCKQLKDMLYLTLKYIKRYKQHIAILWHSVFVYVSYLSYKTMVSPMNQQYWIMPF